MRKLMVALTALTFVACSGPTGPEGIDVPDGPLQMALVSGAGQEVTVTDTLPTDIVVRVEKGGEALPDQLVDWTVLHDNCGSAFVTTTRTDSEGQTGNRLVAGTRAWTRPDGPDVCQMEVRYALTVADTVQARVDTTVSYRVEPGRVHELRIIDDGYRWSGGPTLTVTEDVVADRHGNPALWRLRADCCAHRAGDEYGSRDALTMEWDSAGSGVIEAVVADTVVATGEISTGDEGTININFQG